MNFENHPQPAATSADAALQARLAALASKRQAAPASAAAPGTPSAPVAPTARTSTRRRHPAKHSRTAALVLSFVSTGGLGYLLAATDAGVSAAPVAPAGFVNATPTAPVATAASTTAPAAAASAPSTASPEAASTAPTSTVAVPTTVAEPIVINGETFTNKWGPVQVQASFAPDGTLMSVDALQTPSSKSKSVRINDYAVPRLNSSALTAGSAQVDSVSGATYTSVGYRQSLQSAIDIAVANGIPAAAAQAS